MIAILSTDPILSRMLTLEAARGGFSLVAAQQARLWLLDLDHPPRGLPPSRNAYVIGFTKEEAADSRADLTLPLPYPTKELQALFGAFAQKDGRKATLRHLPGIALVGESKVHLSPTEERLFTLLLDRRGEVVTEGELLAALGESTATANVLQVHIYRLRRKLSGGGASYIRAVRGKGYRLALE